MSKKLVFGHQNPDTDATGAAMSLSYLANQKGFDTEAVVLGEVNKETAFALNHFGLTAPRVIEQAGTEVDSVMLVDHNEFGQSVSDIEDVKISHVVDHHRISDFHTADPLFYRAEPLGAASTVLWKMYQESNIEIPKGIAGMMLSAIISDTLLFKSPTTTPTDEAAAKDLASIAGVDIESYGLDMLKAGADLSDKSEAELIDIDAKSFEMGSNSVRIAQINAVDLDNIMQRSAALEESMHKEIADNNYQLFVTIVTDILNSNSIAIVLGDDTAVAKFETAFTVSLKNNHADLPGVVSRKKQVVPQLTEQLAK
ncbi:manganese-dependent inorganic pyrophosphatase [Holzapfeliella floricola]|uniref:Probable manganese-dependent inorganic pyrophosphatase n=1 Tax=Holzapfeliella floricola DSM 23037 = JCM 16512 TaxID=1423744 RepID=A0A0R2DHX1_9LACO|nr:manganese-dependent inorganic pyrophosphatase [Holzapfeliella floricola]KRN03697.1 manganese-dependent inorganic pyrophosphatase [Holzapfeliella floricola DSM 23037 = JCM 16512]